MQRVMVCLLIFSYSFPAPAQRSGLKKNNEDFTALFAFHVKTMDDFFDRFNFRKNTGFQNFIRKNYPGFILTRSELIKQLFNQKKFDINKDKNVSDFVNEVSDSLFPQYLKYDNNDWYAELKCNVLYKNKLQKLTLTLKVERSVQNAFRWSVVSASADFLKFKNNKSDSALLSKDFEYSLSPTNLVSTYSLSPVSHALDFTDLDNIFIHKKHANEYLFDGPHSFELKKLVSLIQKSKIKFSRVNTVTYHLLHAKGWIITVEYFNTNEKNSGWLISKLAKAAPEQKDEYLLTRLNVPKP
jgi:hypothetical protein